MARLQGEPNERIGVEMLGDAPRSVVADKTREQEFSRLVVPRAAAYGVRARELRLGQKQNHENATAAHRVSIAKGIANFSTGAGFLCIRGGVIWTRWKLSPTGMREPTDPLATQKPMLRAERG